MKKINRLEQYDSTYFFFFFKRVLSESPRRCFNEWISLGKHNFLFARHVCNQSPGNQWSTQTDKLYNIYIYTYELR